MWARNTAFESKGKKGFRIISLSGLHHFIKTESKVLREEEGDSVTYSSSPKINFVSFCGFVFFFTIRLDDQARLSKRNFQLFS